MTFVLSPGRTFGRYVVERPLGAGGMGEVVVAFDTFLHRRVALKIVRRDRTSDVAVARLTSEARAAAALHHPNIVTLLDAGEIDGVPFLAMEYVEGRPLRAFVGDPSVPVATKLEWMRQVASGLAAAHAAGIVHRDVKPENVIVSNEGVAKVLDFGIAKRTHGEDVPSGVLVGPPSAHTAHGRVVGTVGYMAPEQLAGGPPSPAWDQYAWGVTTYELLTGMRPQAQAPLLNERVPGVSFEIAATIARTIAAAPEQRWPAMGSVVMVLQPMTTATSSVHSTLGTNAGTAEPIPAARAPARRTWLALVGILLFVLASAAGAVVVLALVHARTPDAAATNNATRTDAGAVGVASVASTSPTVPDAGDSEKLATNLAPHTTSTSSTQKSPAATSATPVAATSVTATSATAAHHAVGCDCNIPKVANLCKKEYLTTAPRCECRPADNETTCPIPWTVGPNLTECTVGPPPTPGAKDGMPCVAYDMKNAKVNGVFARCNACTFYNSWSEPEGAPCSGWSGGKLLQGTVNCAVLKEDCPRIPEACAEAARRGIKVR